MKEYNEMKKRKAEQESDYNRWMSDRKCIDDFKANETNRINKEIDKYTKELEIYKHLPEIKIELEIKINELKLELNKIQTR